MAVAFRNEANMSAIYQCQFVGYRDTLYAKKGLQFYRECNIYGRVDFICGSATVVFQNCNLYARLLNETIKFTAQKQKSSSSGYVIQNCSLTVAPGDGPVNEEEDKAYLGQPWSNYSKVMVIESLLDTLIDPQGWTKMADNEQVDKLIYREYRIRGPGLNTSGRVNWPGYKVIHDALEAKPFTVSEFLTGDLWLPNTGMPYYSGFTTESSAPKVCIMHGFTHMIHCQQKKN
ncbi:Pectinesterase domain-containing protein [Cephalotus follicularis]|uniref:Pectinesterase domain-containing protein n=1 Tax=Cephalotus follicularis TaxID=3775 RepID=A0A1Q3D9H4_CEPFO|nr:Pectinesterase domain-containing protein [Cephalotus follicularis]